ncbi:MAG: hypothetical protein M3Q16_00090 [Pseudomonadota bacterium]|nr:hypothetical protein [Pseudomonadota bacterium]
MVETRPGFYFGENPAQIELLKTSIPALSGVWPSALLAAATAAGLALQACYLSPVAEKLYVWKWVVQALSIAQDSFIKDADPKNQAPLLAFFHYYFYARDSVSLSHLKPFVNTLLEWSKTTESLCLNGNDWMQFG